jgi:MFS family permease
MGPRGVGAMAAMLVVGRLTDLLDIRVLLGIGLGLTAWGFYAMTGWTPAVSQTEIVVVGLVQGAGLGFLVVPLRWRHCRRSGAPKARVSTIFQAKSARASAFRSSMRS